MTTATVERYTVLPTMFDSLCLNTINDLYSLNTLLSCRTSHYTILGFELANQMQYVFGLGL